MPKPKSEREPNIYPYESKDGKIRYAVCKWYPRQAQFQAPLDGETARLTGCFAEFARTPAGIGGGDLNWARRRARALYGYSCLAK